MLIFPENTELRPISLQPSYVASFKESGKTIYLVINKMALKEGSSKVLTSVFIQSLKMSQAKKLHA